MRLVFIIIFFLFYSLKGMEPQAVLDSISTKDKEKLEKLFSYLIQRDSLGYVLFGDTKPAAFSSIPILCKYALIPPSITTRPLRYQTTLKQCWEVWKRHSQKFKHPNIIVCEEYENLGGNVFLQLFFIDKKKYVLLLNKITTNSLKY